MRRRFSEHHRFLALRACWTILRGGSVAYRVNLIDGADSLSSPFLVAECQVAGRPVTPWDIKHAGPREQPS